MSWKDKKIEDVKIMDQKEAGRLLERIGKDIIERGEVEIQGIRLVLPKRVEVETEYKKKEGRNKLEIELKWYGDEIASHHLGTHNDTETFSSGITASAVKIATLSQLSPWEMVNFNYPTSAYNAILIVLPERELRAYSTVCAHKGKSLRWDEQSRKLCCPTHGAVFTPETGEKIKGPGDRFLKKVHIETRGDIVFAVGIDG